MILFPPGQLFDQLQGLSFVSSSVAPRCWSSPELDSSKKECHAWIGLEWTSQMSQDLETPVGYLVQVPWMLGWKTWLVQAAAVVYGTRHCCKTTQLVRWYFHACKASTITTTILSNSPIAVLPKSKRQPSLPRSRACSPQRSLSG